MMEVIYGYQDGQEIRVIGSFHDTCVEAPDRIVWLLADGTPLKPLPPAFNRELIIDRNCLRSAVFYGSELAGGYCIERDGAWPLPSHAPMLTIDFNNGRVMWKDDTTEILYDEAVG